MQDGARQGIRVQQERFNEQVNVQTQRTNHHTYVATRLLRDATKYREARRAGILPDNNTNTGRSDRTGQDTQQTTTHNVNPQLE